MIDAVIGSTREEELQRSRHFLGQALHEGLEHASRVVVRQFAAALLGLRLFRRKTVLACNQLGKLCTAKGLITLIQHLVIAKHLHAGSHCAHLE